MKKIFIFSTGYNVRLFLRSALSLLNFDISEIVLLKENHIRDNFLASFSYRIKFVSNLEQGVSYSDITLIIKDESLPDSSICKINQLCKFQRQRCIEVDLSIDPMEYNEYLKNEISMYSNKSTTILCVCIGKAAEHTLTEMVLHNAFVHNNICAQQLYSQTTFSLIKSLSSNNILDSHLASQLVSNNCAHTISVVTMCVDSPSELKHYQWLINNLVPDFVVVGLSRGYLTPDGVSRIIREVFYVDVDIIVSSRYRIVNNEFTVYCDEPSIIDNNVLDIDDREFNNELITRIFSKLALPKGITRL